MARYPYREIVEMRSVGLSLEKVAYLCGCGAAKVSDVVRQAKLVGLEWPLPPELDDDDLEALVDPLEATRCLLPDFALISEALGVRELTDGDLDKAYATYLSMASSDGREAYVRSTFKALMRDWAHAAAAGVQMPVNWYKGECVQVDWAGRKLALYKGDGTSTPAYLFVATLPYSDMTFVRASLDMKMQSWLEHHRAMFSFFGGIPLFLVPDNLTQAVTKKGFNERYVNQKYRDMADFYGALVVPTRPLRPTDKGAVEGHVRIMANSIVSTLEGMRFTSLAQLNDAISKLLAAYNRKPSAALRGRSREQVFLAEEKPCLQPLPACDYVPTTWRKCTVGDGGVVRVQGNYYGVPGAAQGDKVYARVTMDAVDVYDRTRRHCLASHPRREDGEETFEGYPGTCPDRLCPLDDWARMNGRMRVVEQWDFEANAGLSPSSLVCRSLKVVGWRCPDCGYAWSESVANRTRREWDDCPRCAGVVLVPGVNDLATTHPGIAAEWDRELNPMGPDEVFADYGQQVWWRGKCGHSWAAPISKRTRSAEGALCPYCAGWEALPGFNDVATLCPELAGKWHPSRNRRLGPGDVAVNANHAVYLWDGVMTRAYRMTPRAWMKANGLGDVLAPFEGRVAEARRADAAAEAVPTHSSQIGTAKAVSKWHAFNERADLGVSLEEWCVRFRFEYLLEEWDSDRNGNLRPDRILRASMQRVWWRGRKCGHSWLMSVRARTFSGGDCPYCSRLRVLPGFNSLDSVEPELVRYWHPTKNGKMRISEVTDRSHRAFWWQCPKCGYEWKESPRRTNRLSRKCPNCNRERTGYMVPGRNDLASKRPSVAALFADDLNDGLSVDELFRKTKRKVWWRGECGHVWQARVDQIAELEGAKCPYCGNRKLLRGFNDLATVDPGLANEWNCELNGELGPGDVLPNAKREVWWTGPCGHEYQMQIRLRHLGQGCPYCANRRTLLGGNDLATLRPEVAAQWDYEGNAPLTPEQVRASSNKVVWWRCEKGHRWQLSVNNKVRWDAGCPVCANRMVVPGVNDIATTHKRIAREWDRERNGDLRPRDVHAGSTKAVWWKCKEGHEWRQKVAARTRSDDPRCPYCRGRKAWPGFNDLATVRPDIAAEWHPHMNKPLKPTDVLATSSREVWWHAECGHTWKQRISTRTRPKEKQPCPICSGRIVPERPIDLGDKRRK